MPARAGRPPSVGGNHRAPAFVSSRERQVISMVRIDWNFSSTAELVTGGLLVLTLLAGIAAIFV